MFLLSGSQVYDLSSFISLFTLQSSRNPLVYIPDFRYITSFFWTRSLKPDEEERRSNLFLA